MSFPKFVLLILFGVLAATTVGIANIGTHNGGVPQRLRVRVENHRLRTDETTKVTVELLDRNYAGVANDATRTIKLGQTSSGSNQTGSVQFDREEIVVKAGDFKGEASFTSRSAGRLFITANTEGLEPGQALVSITAQQSVSLLTRFVSLFETVAHAQDDPGFEVAPTEIKATANGKHRATFQVSFKEIPDKSTKVRISTNLTSGEILYRGEHIGKAVANIPLAAGEDISDEISVVSTEEGDIDVTASVLPNGPTAKSRIKFTRPQPTKIIFDADPLTIGSRISRIPLTVRLVDEGGFPIEPEFPQTISFSRTSESDQVSFMPESVVVEKGKPYAHVLLQVKELPPGDELRLLATNDQGMGAAEKTLQIESAIEKILISGATKAYCSGAETEYTVSLANKDGRQSRADRDRQIYLNADGGALSTPQVVIPKGSQQAVFRYKPADDSGKYVLRASSAGIPEGTYSINVVHPMYWLALFALFGGVLGAVAREADRSKTLSKILPRRIGKRWDTQFAARLVVGLVGALLFYLTYSLGLEQVLGVRALPVVLDPGITTVAFFLGCIGGFSGTLVLTGLTKVFLQGDEPQAAAAG